MKNESTHTVPHLTCFTCSNNLYPNQHNHITNK